MKKIFFLIALLPLFAKGQILNVSGIADAPPGVITVTGTFTSFSTTTGTFSSAQTVTWTAVNLIDSVIWTTGTGMEISKDGTTWAPRLAYAQSGGSASGTLHARIAAATTPGTYISNIPGTSIKTGTANVPYSATVVGVPSMSVNTNSITTNGTSGTPGTSASFILTFANIVGSIALNSATPVEISIDGGSTYAFTQSVSSGSPLTVKARTAASASAQSVSQKIIASAASVTNDTVLATGTIISGVVLDSLPANVDTTLTQATGHFVNLTGDPAKTIKTGTGGISNTITITTISTANYNPFGGNCAFPTNGTGNYLAYAPNVAKEVWFCSNSSNLDAFNVSFPKFRIGGLLPGHHYTISFYSGYTFALNGNTEYRVNNGTTTFGPQTFQSLNYSGTGPGAVLTNVTCDVSGNLNIYFNAVTGQDISALAGFILQQTD